MKIIKLISILFVFILFLQCDIKKREQKILVQKIKIENELCENCIGLRTIKIKYIFNTDKLLKSTVFLSTNDSFLFKMRRFKDSSVGKSPFHYEYTYDEFNLSKYGSLTQIKKDYKQIIYFKRIKIDNTDLELVTDEHTEILYYLNGLNINEKDSLKMNKNTSGSELFIRHR